METLNNLKKAYSDKKVLVTGHTGFKGTWLSRMLVQLGADVYGIGLDEGRDKIFVQSQTSQMMNSTILDIRNQEALSQYTIKLNPQVVFHLAAQPLVIESYKAPIDTFAVNMMGTAYLLEGLRYAPALEAAVLITTDKVYRNNEWFYPYRESDPLGGYDPYSASKAACEIVISSYMHSFFQNQRICSVRAGNVIGGGDFADNRIIPDIVRSIQSGKDVVLRAPNSIRPWQHVLDALWGYILVGEVLINQGKTSVPSYNIAPPDNTSQHTVLYVVKKIIETIGQGTYRIDESSGAFKEMNRLRLDASLIQADIGWKPGFTTDEAIVQTALEYKAWLKEPQKLGAQLDASIAQYLQKKG